MRLTFVLIAFALIVCQACEGPTSSSGQEFLDGLTMTPRIAEVPLGGRQQFTVTSVHGQLDGKAMYVRPPFFSLYDGECDCMVKKQLGRLERLGHDLYEFVAPTSIRRSYRLPAVADIKVDTNVDHETVVLATITITH